MRLIRWFFTFILLFIAIILAILLMGMLLVAFGVFKAASLMRLVRETPKTPAEAPPGQRPPRLAGDLPDAPPNAVLHKLRSWDAAHNRAVERWYYKDQSGQWVFVRPPGAA